MRNLKPYDDDCFKFYKTVVESKRNPNGDPDYKSRIKALDEDVREYYQNYEEEFSNNNLECLHSVNFDGTAEDDLARLYSYRNNAIQELLVKLTTAETGRLLNTCQNCTINEVDSFDHYLPKSQYIEFNVNPKNLFPCCTVCNRRKSSAWKENGQRIYLNLYLDPLPNLQYLHVRLSSSDNILETQFYLEKPDEMDQELYSLIVSHYNNLDLLERFSKNSDEKITSLINDVSSYTDILSYETIYETTAEKLNKNRTNFGYNYWVSILGLALLESNHFRALVI